MYSVLAVSFVQRTGPNSHQCMKFESREEGDVKTYCLCTLLEVLITWATRKIR